MSFIASIFSAIVDVIVSIVEAVVAIVEMVVQLIMVLLGWDTGSTQIIEYYEVHNIPLFDNVDKKNPLLNSIISSVLADQDIASNLIYHLAFRSLKGNVQDFMNFIDNGNYFENFPTVESYILTIDYTELTAALATLNGVPCTPEGSFLRALSKSDWVKYWLQENKEYNVGTNTIGVDFSTTSTSTPTPVGDTIQVIPSANHYDINITSILGTADEVFADERWQVDLTDIVYNSIPDTYTIKVHNAATVGSVIRTLPYTAPTKPTQLHYVSTYYRDSAPARQYIFIYKVGTGVYVDLDTVETPIDQDGTTIEALPAIPLRLSNANYTTFGATKSAQIEALLDRIHLDAAEVLNTIITRSSIAANDLDHVYVNFGVRMWDTSQAGMSYLFTMFENLYPSQGITQGTYNNTAAGDDKPQNNIITTTDDNKLAFQWSYITYAHTSLTDINANTGSTENGIYYSDMSKFIGGVLKYNYYVSSGKGTYNVGYKADTLAEVQDFLDGNGVINPGTTSTEAANWLQVTERMSYNNPSPVLQEADGSTADLKYLTPDLVYENSGSGVTALTVTGGGSGYSSPPTVAITGGGGSGATATAVLTAGAVSSITITTAGSGYTTLPTVTLTGGGGAGATATAGTSGVLRLLEKASPETTIGQSITYYCVKPSGLDAYTVVAPIASMRVVDGSSGHFRVVKFNLGNKADLMAPFIHNFIKNLSNDKVSRLFLAGCHASIYVAHYEKIVQEGMSWLTALVMIVIIVVIAYYAYPMLKAGFGKMMLLFADMAAASTLTGALSIMMGAFIKSIPTMLIKMAAQYFIEMIITELVGDNPELAMILNLLATVAIASWDVGVTIGSVPGTAPLGSYGNTGGSIVNGQLVGGGTLTTTLPTLNPQGVFITGATSFSLPDMGDPMKVFSIGMKIIDSVGKFLSIRAKSLNEELDVEIGDYGKLMGERYQELKEKDAFIDTHAGIRPVDLRFTQRKMFQTASLNAESYYQIWDNKSNMIPSFYNHDYPSLAETSIQFV